MRRSLRLQIICYETKLIENEKAFAPVNIMILLLPKSWSLLRYKNWISGGKGMQLLHVNAILQLPKTWSLLRYIFWISGGNGIFCCMLWRSYSCQKLDHFPASTHIWVQHWSNIGQILVECIGPFVDTQIGTAFFQYWWKVGTKFSTMIKPVCCTTSSQDSANITAKIKPTYHQD